ncbi:MAG: VOC family protein [Micromonosporaceae bacterium]
MNPMTHGIDWFEIGTDNPAATERFYGDVFGWTFADDENADEMPYRIATTPAEGSIKGGVLAHGGKLPNYAVFYVLVADVADTCQRAEAAGGKVLVPPTEAPDGLKFAHLLDPTGCQLGVFTRPAGG